MPTIHDVARAAGVSITTVSHVMNDTRYVSDELRQRVSAAMKQLAYQPNSLARGLRVGKTKTLGLILPDSSNLAFVEMARTIEDIGYQAGYSVILSNTDGVLAKQSSYVETMIAKQVDGVIFISAGDSEQDLQRLADAGIPVVILDREVSRPMVDTVVANNELGGYLATRYLVELGHRQIACITGPSEFTPSGQRGRGYRRALQEGGIEVHPEYLVAGDFRFEGGQVAMRQLLALPHRPTAVFVSNDMMALGAMQTARNEGLDLPRDLSVVGYDDIPLAQAMYPPLTTVVQPKRGMGTRATELLLRRIEAGAAPGENERIVLDPVLAIRQSCTVPPEAQRE